LESTILRECRSRKLRGTAFIEFALVLVILIPLAIGIIDASVAILNKTLLTNASREGARAAIRYSSQSQEDRLQLARDRALSYVSTGLITFSIAQNVPQASANLNLTTQQLTVSVTYSYTGLMFFNSMPLSGTTVMKWEG
jgi:Flp pilus assembly protein TadG